jgi:hypothetical protein
MPTSASTSKVDISFHENRKIVENQKKAADHFHLAARGHLAAARHHEAGAYEKAAENTFAAYGHSLLANEYQKEVAKIYALKAV